MNNKCVRRPCGLPVRWRWMLASHHVADFARCEGTIKSYAIISIVYEFAVLFRVARNFDLVGQLLAHRDDRRCGWEVST